MDIFEQVCDIIRENIAFDENVTFTEDMTFSEMELDSLDVVDCIMCIEDEMDITIDDSELDSIRTLGDLIELIKEKKGM